MTLLQSLHAGQRQTQNAAQLWAPNTAVTTASTNAIWNTASDVTFPMLDTAPPAKPRKQTPLEWLDDQISEVRSLATP